MPPRLQWLAVPFIAAVLAGGGSRPSAIVAFLFLVSWQALGGVQADPAQSAGVRVKVTGFQWCWKFEYVDEGVTVEVPARNSRGENCRDEDGGPPTLVVPVGPRSRPHLPPPP